MLLQNVALYHCLNLHFNAFFWKEAALFFFFFFYRNRTCLTQKKTFPDILDVKSHLDAAKSFEMSNCVVWLLDICKPFLPFHAHLMQMMAQSAKSDICKFWISSPAKLKIQRAAAQCAQFNMTIPTISCRWMQFIVCLLNPISIHVL